MYAVSSYGDMLADGVRMRAYEAALRAVVRPGCTVLDLGCGTGIFSLMACRLGAGRVYAIEPGEVIHLARALAVEHGFSDRIDFIQAVSKRVVLPQPVDVIVADLRGCLPAFRDSISAMADARVRFLAPGGTLIPRLDTLCAAVVEMPEMYDRLLRPWARADWNLDLTAARESVLNSVHRISTAPTQMLTEGRAWTSIDYELSNGDSVRGEFWSEVCRPGPGHGLAAWFKTTLMEGIEYSSGPGDKSGKANIYGHLFFPWPEAVALNTGDMVVAEILGSPSEDDYIWSWESSVIDSEGRRKAQFRQSTFLGNPAFFPTALDRFGPDARPVRNRDGDAAATVIGMMDGGNRLSDITRCIGKAFPDSLPSDAAAHRLVTSVIRQFSD